jgi:transposase-like protein
MTLTNKTKLDFQIGDYEPDLVELFRAMFNSEIGKEIIKKSNPKSLDDLVGKDGLVAQFLKPFIEEISKAELCEHLGYEKHSTDGYNTGNSRNGSYKRKVNTSDGPVEILVPRDRNGEYKPHLLDTFKRNSPEFEAKIMALYARGSTTKNIANFVEETYGVSISESFVSDITDKVLDKQKEWQSRELQTTYAFAYLDAIHIPTRINGKVSKRALHVVLAYDLEGHKEVLGNW